MLGPAAAVLAVIGADVAVFFASEKFRNHQPTPARHIERPAHQFHTGQFGERAAQQHRA
ncbi:MAG: hypothetical protein JO096_01735 [Alphaproteobacteria bacterium]|nr:hypothetical protein [Alphaproteobacteria bacterium]